MKKEIVTISPGDWDSFIKCIKKLPFLKVIEIVNGKLKCQLNSYTLIWIDLSEMFGNNINLSFLIDGRHKELNKIPINNDPIKIYDCGERYLFTNKAAYIHMYKYKKFDEMIYIENICFKKQIGETVKIEDNHSKTMYNITKVGGSLDFNLIDDVLVSIENVYGSLFPIAKNAKKDVIDTKPTSRYRSFHFSKMEGKETIFSLFEVMDDPEGILKSPSIWLYAAIDIDTSITLHYFERLIPILDYR